MLTRTTACPPPLPSPPQAAENSQRDLKNKNAKKGATNRKRHKRAAKDVAHAAPRKVVARTVVSTKPTAREQMWKQRFDEVDVDNSGELDIDELGELMALLGSDCTLEQLQQTMKELDTDGGGTLDWDEFKCWLQTLPTEKKRAGAIVATTGAAVTTHHTAGEQRKVVI